MARFEDAFRADVVELGKKALAPYNPKCTQESAGYVAKARGQERCANCALFESPNTCGFVFGEISPEGVCSKLYEGRE